MVELAPIGAARWLLAAETVKGSFLMMLRTVFLNTKRLGRMIAILPIALYWEKDATIVANLQTVLHYGITCLFLFQPEIT